MTIDGRAQPDTSDPGGQFGPPGAAASSAPAGGASDSGLPGSGASDNGGVASGVPGLPPLAGPEQPAYWYVTYPEPPATDPGRRRRRRILTVIIAGWIALLLGTGVWYSFHGTHTVREQTTIGEAVGVVDGASARVLSAAGLDPAVVVGGFIKTGDCSVTPVRGGEQWARGLRLATPVGTEAELLRRIADGLPAGYHARVRGEAKGTTLYADAGEFVAVSGSVESDGLVRVVVSTGCRPVGHRPAADPTSVPAGAQRSAVESVLADYGVAASAWESHELRCGTGVVRTVTAVAAAEPAQLNALDAGAVLVSGEHLVAARNGQLSTVVRATGTGLAISTTTGSCAG